jgi:hypothetical protein
VGTVLLAALAVVATLATGLSAWADFLTLLVRVSDPITTEHNFTPGAVAYQLGVPRGAASILQVVSTAGAVLVVVILALRGTAVAGYHAAVVASQLVSPVLWDHYAMLLLVPVAWLLSVGVRWAALVPLLMPVALVAILPPIVYPIAFWLTLGAVAVTGLQRGAYLRSP